MKTTVTKPAISCDGCGYLVGMTVEERASTHLRDEDLVCELRIPWDVEAADRAKHVWLTFHFHAPQRHRSDCFRYWAHTPYIMKGTLAERGLSPKQIDEFLSTFLYREERYAPGIERPKEEAKT